MRYGCFEISIIQNETKNLGVMFLSKRELNNLNQNIKIHFNVGHLLIDI